MTKSAASTDTQADYRKLLVSADQKGQEELDKAILSLSGGGLGVSLVFLKDIVGPNPITWSGLLMGAWGALALSLLSVLVSMQLGNLAVREAIRQMDSGLTDEEPFGGAFARWTHRLNAAGIGLFVFGVLLITGFASLNLPVKENKDANQAASTAASAPARADSSPGRGR